MKATDFDFNSVNFTGTVPESRAFEIYILRPPTRMIPDRRLYSCQFDKCTRIYANLYKLFDHIRSHSNEKPYMCTHGCGRGFSQIGNRNKHELYIHS